EELRPRVLQTLAHAFLTPSLALSSHYGVIRGIAELGSRAVRTALLPQLQLYLALLGRELRGYDSGPSPGADRAAQSLRREEADRVFFALLATVAGLARQFFQRCSASLRSARALREQLLLSADGLTGEDSSDDDDSSGTAAAEEEEEDE